jgi:hypothetical protein
VHSASAREADEAFGCCSWPKAFGDPVREIIPGRNVCVGEALKSEDLTIAALGAAILLDPRHGSPCFHAVGLCPS